MGGGGCGLPGPGIRGGRGSERSVWGQRVETECRPTNLLSLVAFNKIRACEMLRVPQKVLVLSAGDLKKRLFPFGEIYFFLLSFEGL